MSIESQRSAPRFPTTPRKPEPDAHLPKENRSFDLLVSGVWSIFSHGLKELALYCWRFGQLRWCTPTIIAKFAVKVPHNPMPVFKALVRSTPLMSFKKPQKGTVKTRQTYWPLRFADSPKGPAAISESLPTGDAGASCRVVAAVSFASI